jgi:hypothetical protein
MAEQGMPQIAARHETGRPGPGMTLALECPDPLELAAWQPTAPPN